ncbi:thioredoxin-disulfide reductase [Xanthobacter pseudotagetidis]|uniref:thioredoxin-disulfide reductase n=1 Tax=Xanthobacter pseudotagetidis TaxID=3119911 RepID=UPI0037282889
MERRARIIILGGGPAGLTAAIYAARAGLRPLLLAGLQPGGQLTTTTEVENFPGFASPVQGPWLMAQMQAQAELVGAEIACDSVHAADLSVRPFRLEGDAAAYRCEALVIATGAKARWLGVPGESALSGYGVSACATCDGFFYRGKSVAVVGGGNTAVEEALYLSSLAAEVTLIHRRDTLRCERILGDRLAARPNVRVLWNHVVEAVVGDAQGERPALRAALVRDLAAGTPRELPVDGLFVAIGHAPETGLFRNQLPMDDAGYLLTVPGRTATAVPGVFAAGDVQDPVFRQAVTAAGSGCMAALEAERWLAAALPAAA